MNSPFETYTYRCGEKMLLNKNPHQFVVRALPHQLKELEAGELEQVSSASTRITTSKNSLETKMKACRGLGPTHHAYQLKDTQEEFLITDRVFVKFKKRPSQKTLNKFTSKYGLVLLKNYDDKEFLFQLTDNTKMNPVKLVVKLTEEEALVTSAGHDLNVRFVKYESLVPTDPSYNQQWHLHNRLQDAAFDIRASVNCEAAWSSLGNYGSPEVAVAVTDDGCRLDHEDFDSPNKFAAWGYFQGQTLITNADIQAQPSLMYEPGADHGTSCAGVIAGEADAIKTVGAAPDCRLLPIKWESDGSALFISDSKLLTALDFIADKVDVMSNSWGSSPTSIFENRVVDRIEALSQTGGKRGKGIIFLWAAGNENCPIQVDADIDIPFTQGVQVQNGQLFWVGVETSRRFRHNLVNIPGVMYIAALSSAAQRSHYSNYGPGISLTAPSSNGHTYFRMQVTGLGITTTTGLGTGITNDFGGTSSATPLVAGIAALVISANPDLSASEVIALLKSTASKDLDFTEYPKTAPTDFDPDTSWDVSPVAPFDTGQFVDDGSPEGTWSPWFGHGKVDALAAITSALAGVTPQPPNPDPEPNPAPTGTFQATNSPSLAIPDNNPTGVVATINVPKTGSLTAITLALDISHTYRGDLVVSLIAPSGKETILHNRSGASANDLKVTFDNSNSALDSLLGEAINGDWQLSVKDLAGQDIGTLNNWEIDLKFNEAKEVNAQESPGITIPDNNPSGIERTLTIAESGKIRSIEVAIDLTHTYIGDLTVTLISPQSNAIILHERTGRSADNIIRTFTASEVAALAALQGESVQGDWRLRVVDAANRDEGKLNLWGLRIELE